MKKLIENYRYYTYKPARKQPQKCSSLWAVTMPVGFAFIIWICTTTAHQMDSGRLVIELDVKEYVRIRADIDKRSSEFPESTGFE